MEQKVNGRRGFLKGFGFTGVVLGGALGGYHAATQQAIALANSAATANNSMSNDSSTVSGVSNTAHLAPRDSVPTLMITGDNRPPEPPKPVVYSDNNGYTMTCSTSVYNSTLSVGSSHGTTCPSDKLNRVSMAVGKDDRLWIKVDDQWRRVALES